VSTALVEMEPGSIETVTPTPAPTPAPVRKKRRSQKRNDDAIGPWVWSGAEIDSWKESKKLKDWWKGVPDKFKTKHEEAIAAEKKSAADWLKKNAKRLREVGEDAGRDARIGSYADLFDSVLKKYGETTIERVASLDTVADDFGLSYGATSSWEAIEEKRTLFEGDHTKSKGVARLRQSRGDREKPPALQIARPRRTRLVASRLEIRVHERRSGMDSAQTEEQQPAG
jgi:hypothetical protein